MSRQSSEHLNLDCRVQELQIHTPNGHMLSVVKFESSHSENQTLVISSATGVLQGYYHNFAKYFANQGFVVYTFDYYGIGKSGGEITELKQNHVNLKTWGQNDQAAVVTFAKNENKKAHLTLITHSIGGQLLGFNPSHTIIDKVILVASQTGYWKTFKNYHRLKMWTFWHFLIPVSTPLFGYFPAKKMGLFENLPKNVVYEWASWGKKKEYMMHFHSDKEYHFDALQTPILALSFSKDDFAPKEAVDWLAKQYKNAAIQRVHHEPRKDQKHVKHFGFFKSAFKDPLWKQTHQWILTNTFE